MIRALPLLALLAAPAAAQVSGPDPALVEEGRALAVAGDCTACHGADHAGGDPIESPIGAIHASNITPDPETGIGSWSLADFDGVMREGRSPEHMIYPAMPYVSYTGLTDGQVEALYAYLTTQVAPIAKAVPENDLPFPFNMRFIMAGWNLFFLDEGSPPGAVPASGPQAERGRVLVEVLGHCSACHTPRGPLMQQRSDRHLGGGMVSGWWAPNLTPGAGGLSDWSDDELATFLATGSVERAVAAGEMGLAVEHSLSRMPREDIRAIVAYLRALPPVDDADPVEASGPTVPVGALMDVSSGPAPSDWRAMLGHADADGATLYEAACASCHRSDGTGRPYPSLRRVSSVTDPDGANLVQVIANGVDRRVGGEHRVMPGFRAAMDDAQIAALANHVRVAFAGVPSDIDADRVAAILAGEIAVPWLIRNATWLAWLGLGAGLGAAFLGAFWVWRRRMGGTVRG